MTFYLKKWIGKTLIIIGIVHSCFGLVVFRGGLAQIVHNNFLGTISLNSNAEKETAFWFLMTGFSLILIGALVNWIEGEAIGMPTFLPWSLAAITALGVVMMPASGFWLLLIPIAGLYFQKK